MSTTMPALKRFEMFVTRDLGNGDQIPAEALIDFYAQGATVDGIYNVTGPQSILLYSPGALREGDIVTVFRPNGTFSDTLEVTAMSDDDSRVIDVDVVAGSVGLTPGDRLIVKSARRPLVFLDPAATKSLGSTLSTDSEVGWGRGYVREFTYDCVVGITGQPLRLFPDAVGGFVMRIRK